MLNIDIIHPERYLSKRAYISNLLKLCSDFDPNGKEAILFANEKLVQEYNRSLSIIPIHERAEKIPSPTNIMNEEVSLFIGYLRFKNSGSNIFNISDKLMEMFENTEVGNIELEHIKFPYNRFYLSFSAQNDYNLSLNDSEKSLIDGVYIEKMAHSISFRFTSLNSKKTSTNHWLLNREETFFLGLQFENEKTTVNEAIQAEYDRQKEDLSKFDDMAFEGEIDGVKINMPDTDERKAVQKKRYKRMENGFNLFPRLAKIAFNALCFLASDHKQIQSQYSKNAPVKLIEKLGKTKNKEEVKKIKAEIKKVQYTKIILCDLRQEANKSNEQTGKEIATHWRRGHWRKQPYGENNSQIKLIWIYPT